MKPTVFIATPIAGFTDEKEYNVFREKIKVLSMKLSEKVSVISEILNVPSFSKYESPYESAIQDFKNIELATFFVLVYPQKVPTSALVELGFSLALHKKILILTTDQETLPYMLKEVDKVYSNVKISYFPSGWDDVDDTIYKFVFGSFDPKLWPCK
jgi:hypothetical protein